MSEGLERFAARYPRVWHVIEADGAGDWLGETGLLPAVELCRLAGLPCEGKNRTAFQPIDLDRGRSAILRPQLMQDHRLLPTLAGTFTGRPDLWRQHIDRHVFFWTETRRRDAFARACTRLHGAAARPPVVLTINTEALLEHHGALAFFARINTGSTLRGGVRARRDESTLRPVIDYRSGLAAELAIRGRVDLSAVGFTEA